MIIIICIIRAIEGRAASRHKLKINYILSSSEKAVVAEWRTIISRTCSIHIQIFKYC